MNYYQNRNNNYQNHNNSGQGALRLYSCYTCRSAPFETRAKAPKCRGCNKVLKGKYISK